MPSPAAITGPAYRPMQITRPAHPWHASGRRAEPALAGKNLISPENSQYVISFMFLIYTIFLGKITHSAHGDAPGPPPRPEPRSPHRQDLHVIISNFWSRTRNDAPARHGSPYRNHTPVFTGWKYVIKHAWENYTLRGKKIPDFFRTNSNLGTAKSARAHESTIRLCYKRKIKIIKTLLT